MIIIDQNSDGLESGNLKEEGKYLFISRTNKYIFAKQIDTQGFEANILLGAKKLISSGAPVVIEFWPYGLKLNNSFDKLKDILKNLITIMIFLKRQCKKEKLIQKILQVCFLVGMKKKLICTVCLLIYY